LQSIAALWHSSTFHTIHCEDLQYTMDLNACCTKEYLYDTIVNIIAMMAVSAGQFNRLLSSAAG
jgi:hypothetical protein